MKHFFGVTLAFEIHWTKATSPGYFFQSTSHKMGFVWGKTDVVVEGNKKQSCIFSAAARETQLNGWGR